MKLKPFVRIQPGRISGGTTLVDDKPRADMFLPAWLFSMGVFCLMFGTIAGVVIVALHIPVLLLLLDIGLVVMGVVALMCWKNQTIHMLSDDLFEYRTFLGKKRSIVLMRSKA